MSEKSPSGGRFRELSFLAKHSVIYGVGNMLSRIVAFVMLPIYTRYLTPFDYGVLEIVDTTVSMIGLVAGLGIAGAMSRFYFESEDETHRKRVVSTTLLLVGFTATAIVLLIVPFSQPLSHLLFDKGVFGRFFNVALITLLLGLLIDVAQSYLRILQRSHIYVAISLANLILSVSLNIYFVVFAGQGVFGILLASLIAKSVIAVPLLIAIVVRVGLVIDRKLAGQMYRFSLPLIPTDLASTAIGYSDRYFINHFLSTADAGIYGLAQKLGTVMHVLITSPFLMTYLPRRFEIEKQPNARIIFNDVFYYHMLLLFVASTLLAMFSRELLMVIATPAFFAAYSLIPLMTFAMILLGMKYHFQFGIMYAKQTKYLMYSNFIAALVHVTLNFVLIRYLGLWGALFASIAAFGCNTWLTLVFANRLHPIAYEFRRLALLAGIATGAVVAAYCAQLLGSTAGVVAAKIAIAALFVWALFATQLISRSDREHVALLLKQRSRSA